VKIFQIPKYLSKKDMILKLGSQGELVKTLQRFLKIKDDGDFGPMTESAVKKWQKDNGLLDDGIVGSKTLSKMGLTINESLDSELDISKLKGHIPDSVYNEIPTVIDKFNINTPLRLSHFLAQCAHESGNFRVVTENLNYSISGLKKTFGRYFPNNLAESYARNPEKIASRVYGSRMGNGDETTKEGWKFRGRGYIQLTGKNNYEKFADSINEDVVSNPDLVSEKYPLTSAAWFFKNNCINKCDEGASYDTIKKVTRCVNGGYNGLEDRWEHFKEYYNLLK
jgi:putative chitinase